MCMGRPKIPEPVPPAQYQPMTAPKDMATGDPQATKRRRRGMWASVFTSPQGITSLPRVTGSSGGVTGG